MKVVGVLTQCYWRLAMATTTPGRIMVVYVIGEFR
jgi:hypothetical protein